MLSPLPYLIFFQRPVRPILRLQQNGSRFKALQAMPLSFLYIQHHTTRHHINSLNKPPIRVIEILLKVPTDANTSLRRSLMSVDRHHGSWLKCVSASAGIKPQMNFSNPDSPVTFQMLSPFLLDCQVSCCL